ncbi:MAG: M2 family metallopeptidase, partial [Steroidobacteraceae bacterium]
AATPSAPAAGAASETPDEFVARVNRELTVLAQEAQAAGFTQDTDITPDTELLTARATERYLAYLSRAVAEAQRYDGQRLSGATARALMKLRLNVAAPAPDDPVKRARMTQLEARMQSMYTEGRYCPHGPKSCKSIDELQEVMATSRDYAQLRDAWRGWHGIGAGMRDDYAEFVGLANEGARELGFADLGVMWRSGYDMSPQAFEDLSERLWQQVKPLYVSLQCYARGRLAQRYGAERVSPGKPIPAQLFGNMWAQQWTRIYADILRPYPQAGVASADARLKSEQWDAVRMARSAESFYTSLGFAPLPASFWQRSMLTRPRDREVVCHASAWDMAFPGDVRIKACLEPTEQDLYVTYHELGHVYYYLSYARQPFLFRNGANDGFHEAIGDTVNLSVTPGYLASIGLIPQAAAGREALINQQMKMALEKIPFLPFARLVDEWRWKVFSGEVSPASYDSAWWELRLRYEGIAPPVPRTEADFDPGAKYHIPSNTPYTRYFLSDILQFQFHKALCAAAGSHAPLYECSVYGSREAGRRLAAMLSLGASEPWQDALEKLTGSRDIDAGAILEYFQPLMQWLDEQNKGQQCGW